MGTGDTATVSWRLYVDIGNFAVKYGVRAGGEWVALDSIQHYFGSLEEDEEAAGEVDDLLEEIQAALEECELASEDCGALVVSCTACDAQDFLTRLGRLFPCPKRRLGQELQPEVTSLYRREDLGPDRLANLIAARTLYPLPAIVIDAGTCLTSEIINADGALIGGNIAAGMPLISFGIMSLSERLRQAMEATMEEEPASPVGRSTAHAIYGGIALQLAGTADRFVQAALEEQQVEEATIVITGGDGEVVHDLLNRKSVFNPLLTLEGLRIIDGFE